MSEFDRFVFYEVVNTYNPELGFSIYKYVLDTDADTNNPPLNIRFDMPESPITWSIKGGDAMNGYRYSVEVHTHDMDYSFPRNPRSQVAWMNTLIEDDIKHNNPGYTPVVIFPTKTNDIPEDHEFMNTVNHIYDIDFYYFLHPYRIILLGNLYTFLIIVTDPETPEIIAIDRDSELDSDYWDDDNYSSFDRLFKEKIEQQYLIPLIEKYGYSVITEGWARDAPCLMDYNIMRNPRDLEITDLSIFPKFRDSITFVDPLKGMEAIDSRNSSYTSETTIEQYNNLKNVIKLQYRPRSYRFYKEFKECHTPYQPILDIIANIIAKPHRRIPRPK